MLDVFHKLPVSHDLDDGKVRSRDVVVDTQVKFSTLLLEPQVHDGLARCGYIYLSPIQQNALPLTLTGSSIIAHAKSGTGKTLIFVLPILNDFVKRKPSGLQCLVLAPTREIAKQIYDVFRNVSSFIEGFQVEYFIGGTPVDMDVIKCKDCHVAIGAPGRIKHLIDMGYFSTTSLHLLVLDEVDALFDHKEYAIENIISLLPSPKQLIVCTATFSPKVGELVKSVVPSVKYISADKLEIEEIGNTSNMLVAIKQYVAPVKETPSMRAMKKREKLVEILQNFSFEQCFIFVNYMTLVRSICNHLNNQNFSALWICGDQNQSTRINTINKLKLNHCKILVTTDLAARGIDVHKVNLVINLGIPCPPEIYIHRMGRAGRYGSEGAVITILGEEEIPSFAKMISLISTDTVDLHVLPERLEAGLSNSKVIRCLPVEGSISEYEFTFKRHVKDSQEKTVARIQNNKKAKKKKPKNAMNFASRNGSVGDGTAGFTVIDEASLSLMIPQIEEFSQSLAELVDGQLKPDEESLKRLLEAEDAPSSFAFVQNPSTNLLTYALHVKQKNELVDEQIMPCNVDEFASLTNSQKLFARHSTGLSNLIGEVCGKIWRPKYPRGSVSERSVNSEQSESCSQVSSCSTLSQQLFDVLTNGDEKGSKKPMNGWPKRFAGGCNLAEEFLCVMTNCDESSSSELQSGDGISGRSAIEKDRISDLIACNGERNTQRTEDFNPSKQVPYHMKSAVKNNWRQPSDDFSNQFLNTFYSPVDISSQNTFKIELPSPEKLNLPNHQSSVEHKPRENTKKSNRVYDKSNLSDQLLNAFQNSVSLEPDQNKSEVSSNRPSKKNFLSHQSPDREQLPEIKNERRNQPNPSNNKFDLSSQFLNAFQNSEASTGQNTRNSGPSNQPSESKKPLREHTNEKGTQPNRVNGKFDLSNQFFDAFRCSVTSSSSKIVEASNQSSEKLSNHHSEKEIQNTNEKPRQPNRMGAKFDLSDQFSNIFHSSDTPSSSKITEASNQLSGNVKLSNHHSDEVIQNTNEKARQPNRVGGKFGLADQFLDAFHSSDTSRSCKLAEAPNQSFVELSKHDSAKEIQNANEKTRQSNRPCTGIADQFLNAFQQSPAADTRPRSMPEKQKVSPYQLPRKPNRPNHVIEDEKRLLESTDKRETSTGGTLSLYNQFSNAFADSNIETSTRSASQKPQRSPNDLSRNQNHYHSGFTGNLPYMKNDYGVSNQISNDFNLADQFSKIVDDSVRRADFKNTFKGRRTSPNGFSSNFNHSNKAQSQNWSNERVTPKHSDNRCQRSLSDQFLNSATDSAGFDSEHRTNSYGTSLNVGGRSQSKESKVSNGVWYPEFGDEKNIQDAAILEKVVENGPKSTNENSSPFDPFFYTFGRNDSNKERPEMTFSVSSLFDRFASVQSDKKPVGLQRVVSNLSNIEREPKSDTIPVLKEKYDTSPDLGIRTDLVPEIKNLFLAASTKQNMSSSPKNCSPLSDEANEESSPSVSNSKKPIRALTSDYSPWASEIWKNTVKTAKPQNELHQKLAPSSNATDKILGNQLGAVSSSKQSSRSIPQVENARPSASTVPISAAASHSRAAATTSPPGNPTAVMLPSLRSFVGAQQEQHIWQHHFGFIGRFVASKGKSYQRS